MKTIVMDACAIIAYLRDEEGAGKVESALINDNCFAHAINLSEVYKDCLVRDKDIDIADQYINDIQKTGLKFREDMDSDMWKHAARLKANGKIALADCFALALTDRLKGLLYSSDHGELDPIKDEGKYSIEFIR